MLRLYQLLKISCINSTPSVIEAGPGCRIISDFISWISLFLTALIFSQPFLFLIFSFFYFFPHHEAIIISGFFLITSLELIILSFANDSFECSIKMSLPPQRCIISLTHLIPLI